MAAKEAASSQQVLFQAQSQRHGLTLFLFSITSELRWVLWKTYLSQAFPHNPHQPCVAVGRGSSHFLPWAHGLHTCQRGCSSLMAMPCHPRPSCMVISSLYHPHTSGCWQQELRGARWEVASTSPRCWFQQPPTAPQQGKRCFGKVFRKG